MTGEEIPRDKAEPRFRGTCPGLSPEKVERPKLPIDEFNDRLAHLTDALKQSHARTPKYQRLMELHREGDELAEEGVMLARSADSDIHFAQMRNEEKLARLNELYRAQCDAIVLHYEKLFDSEES
jgi:hypothetical protein